MFFQGGPRGDCVLYYLRTIVFGRSLGNLDWGLGLELKDNIFLELKTTFIQIITYRYNFYNVLFLITL